MTEDWPWPDPDHTPGDRRTLRRLHDLVAAAEEVDILDDVECEQDDACWAAVWNEVPWPDDEPPETDGADGQADLQDAIELVEDQLGATVIGEFESPEDPN